MPAVLAASAAALGGGVGVRGHRSRSRNKVTAGGGSPATRQRGAGVAGRRAQCGAFGWGRQQLATTRGGPEGLALSRPRGKVSSRTYGGEAVAPLSEEGGEKESEEGREGEEAASASSESLNTVPHRKVSHRASTFRPPSSV